LLLFRVKSESYCRRLATWGWLLAKSCDATRPGSIWMHQRTSPPRRPKIPLPELGFPSLMMMMMMMTILLLLLLSIDHSTSPVAWCFRIPSRHCPNLYTRHNTSTAHARILRPVDRMLPRVDSSCVAVAVAAARLVKLVLVDSSFQIVVKSLAADLGYIIPW
jgi:hypothetical protein